ncbi:MAG: S1 RNA-binding domain-containing protein, partial [Clostridia bacterium]|nr:S1 RNA-binding domain-containing protein [Clostridia bacterium]
LYKLAYMSERLGEEYDAVISGVIESGIFAELANTVEGMVRFENLPADRYEYIPEKFLLKGTRHTFRIGDKIKIKVAGCDLGTRRVQFTLV